MKNIIFLTLLLLIVSCAKEDQLIDDNSASIEITYHDWNPDTLVFDSILVDLNNDNFNDLKFFIEKDYQGTSPSGGPYYNYFAKCISVNHNLTVSLGIEVDPSQRDWNFLEFNNLISNNLTWDSSFVLKGQVVSAGGIGLWDRNDTEGYIGIKFESTEVTNFGWIKVDVNYNSIVDKHYEITCFEYAISETNSTIIKAGQIE